MIYDSWVDLIGNQAGIASLRTVAQSVERKHRMKIKSAYGNLQITDDYLEELKPYFVEKIAELKEGKLGFWNL